MAILDKEQIDICIRNIKVHKNDESINFDDINNSMTEINDNYETNNSQKLYNKCYEFYNKFETIKTIHNNYVEVLDKTVTKYTETASKVTNIFDDII